MPLWYFHKNAHLSVFLKQSMMVVNLACLLKWWSKGYIWLSPTSFGPWALFWAELPHLTDFRSRYLERWILREWMRPNFHLELTIRIMLLLMIARCLETRSLWIVLWHCKPLAGQDLSLLNQAGQAKISHRPHLVPSWSTHQSVKWRTRSSTQYPTAYVCTSKSTRTSSARKSRWK